MKKSVIYARQSFGVEEGSVSIDVQIENCKRWAKAHDTEVIGIFKDANCSSELYPACASGIESARVDKGFQNWKKQQLTKGRKEYKDGLGEAFDFIKTNRPDYIIVNTENRLGRSATNSNLKNFMTAFFMENNCSVVDASSNSVMDFSDRLMMAFRQMKDALDYIGVEEKRRSSMESVAKRINSYRVISNAFAVVMDNGVVRFDEKKAEVVRYVYDAVINGTAYSAILHHLNTEYRNLAKGKQWYSTNIIHILENLVYCGFAKNKDGEVKRAVNIPEPIIGYSQWQEAQNIYRGKKAGYQKYNLRGQEKRHWLPFSGYLRCECGRRMTVVIDKGIAYQCKSPDHKMWLKMTDRNETQIFAKSMQSLFVIHAIESMKKLNGLKTISERVDGLKACVERLQNSLKAKFRMVQTDEDYEMLKDEIEWIKRQIAETKAELLTAEAQQTEDTTVIQNQIDREFAELMNGELLPEDEYQRLLAQTIGNIMVSNDSITVNLTDGNSFSLPRVLVNGRGQKTIPESTIYASTEAIENLDTISHYDIVFNCSGDGWSEEQILVDTEDYTVYLRR